MQVDHLSFHRNHGLDDLIVLVKPNTVDAFKALAHVRLHSSWILRLGQDHQQLIVREEEESGECQPLGLEIVVEPLLDHIKLLVGIREVHEQTLNVRDVNHVRILNDGLERVTPQLVHGLELLGLIRHLSDDVVRAKDWLQVEPSPLAHQPLLEQVLDVEQLRLPLLDLPLNWLDKGRATNCLRLDDMVVKHCLNVICAFEQECARVLVRHSAKVHGLPLLLHGLQRQGKAVLLLRFCADSLHCFQVVKNTLIQHPLQGQITVIHVIGDIHDLEKLIEVMWLNGFLAQCLNNRHVLLEGLDVLPKILCDGLWRRLVFKGLEHFVCLLELLVNEGLNLTGIQALQRACSPIFLGVLVLNRSIPQRMVWHELIHNLLEL
mmetsp:Transcript_30364/g.70845  ORF Transcript_30364/g.70845 Transcript_30364/m.70845 type:complete len:377 (+) Transcript_30364:481-1611(+)